PLSAAEVRFLPLAYQFFILNYVVREGSKFFQAPLSDEFRRDAVARYLPQVSSLDVTPILELLGLSS
ncbi:MAG: hypothetical protein EBY96_06550, partial [Actinobacteria bacterium]|nr:hypothetical protein [Actinomycetota bacterium]